MKRPIVMWVVAGVLLVAAVALYFAGDSVGGALTAFLSALGVGKRARRLGYEEARKAQVEAANAARAKLQGDLEAIDAETRKGVQDIRTAGDAARAKPTAADVADLEREYGGRR